MALQSVQYKTQMTTVETIDSGAPAATGAPTVTQGAFNTNLTLNSTTTPPVDGGSKSVVTLSGGAATIDLTALTTINGESVTGTGKRVRMIKIKAAAANLHSITIAKGASNGYAGFGSAFSVTLPVPGTGTVSPPEVCFFDGGSAGVVGSTNKTLDLSGTGTEGVQLEVVFGT